MYFGEHGRIHKFRSIEIEPCTGQKQSVYYPHKVLNEDVFPPNAKDADRHLKFEGKNSIRSS